MDGLFDAQAHIWNYTFKFINTMSLKCAIDLGIPDIIHNHGKPMTIYHMAKALSINPAKSRALYRLMRVLVRSEFFVEVGISDEDESYWLTPASRLLLNHNPFCATPFCRVVGGRLMQEPWHYLSDWLTGDRHLSPFEMAHGATFWDHAERVPRLNRLFNEAMASDSSLVNHVVLRECGEAFRGYKSLVDVGGGTGEMAGAISVAFPDMACVVLDLPHVIAGSKGKDNLTYVEGDMFEAIPQADLVLLKVWI